jgi:hypothetical protein
LAALQPAAVAAATAATTDLAAARQRLRQLRELINSGDSDAHALTDGLELICGNALAADVRRLGDLVEGFDFDNAARLVDIILVKLESAG